jgi:hypothetical protein
MGGTRDEVVRDEVGTRWDEVEPMTGGAVERLRKITRELLAYFGKKSRRPADRREDRPEPGISRE